jgi:hypothetical protein
MIMRILLPRLLYLSSVLAWSQLPDLVTATIDPKLPFGDINVLVLTDVHSWVGGHHRQEPHYDADYGDVLSFYEQLYAHCQEQGQDLWFVSNGDWVHGTGLDAPDDPSSLVPILQKMPWDAVNCGNHELYDDTNVDYMTRPGGFVDWWGDKYLTANVMLKGKNPKPLGNQYKILKGNNADLLVFGFLYDMAGACDQITVEKVENTVKQRWFANALKNEDYDAIMILAHMDLVDPLVDVIRKAIRSHVGKHMPIQFITGHTHYRGYSVLDDLSTSFEAGRYLDTVGFVSFPTKDTVHGRYLAEDDNSTIAPTIAPTEPVDNDPPVTSVTDLFKYVFMDANKQVLKDTLGASQLDTKNGKELSLFIEKAQSKMGLLKEVGCAPHDYLMNTSMDDPDSLWGLYRDEVVPKMFFDRIQNGKDGPGSVMFLKKDSWRYDLFSQSKLLVDDITAIAPFHDIVYYMGEIPGKYIMELNVTMNGRHDSYYNSLPNYILIGSILDEDRHYKLFTHDFNVPEVQAAMEKIIKPDKLNPVSTEYVSTMIWQSFVMEYWPCSGEGILPDWFPIPNIGEGADDGKSRAISIIITIFYVGLVGGCMAGLWFFLRGVFCGGPYMTPQELDEFKIDTDDDYDDYEDDDDSATEIANDNGFDQTNDHAFDPEDGPADEHEML